MYQVFPIRAIEEYAAIVLIESIFAQVDDEGHCYLLLQEIIDHGKDITALDYDFMMPNDSGRRNPIPIHTT